MKISPQAVERARPMLETWLTYQVYARNLPSISIGIVHEGRILFAGGFGYADISAKKVATPRTGYQIASVSKVLTATGIMQLVEHKQVALDEKVSSYLPWFKSTKDPAITRITIKQLLTHTSGLGRDGAEPYWTSDRYPSRQQLIEEISRGVTYLKPASTYKYSNLGSAILAEVIASVSGIPYRIYMKDRVLKPLRMGRTDVSLTSVLRRSHARGYQRAQPAQPHKPFRGIPDAKALAGSTGFSSTVMDLCHFLSGHMLGNRTILTDKSKREMQRAQWTEPDGYKSGFGFEQSQYGKLHTVGKTGGYTGFSSRIDLHQPSRLGVVVLVNAIDGPSKGIVGGIFNILEHYSEARTKPARTLRQCEGIYESRWGDTAITAVGNKLISYYPYILEPFSQIMELTPVSGRTFKITKDQRDGFRNELARFTPQQGRPTTFYTGSFTDTRKKIAVPTRIR